MDLQSIRCQFTWKNETFLQTGPCHDEYSLLLEGFKGYVEVLFLECLSDHFCCVVSVLQEEQIPFKIFNIWTLHENFQGLVVDL